jgi:hypothetical protein
MPDTAALDRTFHFIIRRMVETQQRLALKGKNPANFVNVSFLKRLEEEGFFKKLSSGQYQRRSLARMPSWLIHQDSSSEIGCRPIVGQASEAAALPCGSLDKISVEEGYSERISFQRNALL